ncbi:ImmA/IrrE family metallo-endopeptidase [Pseudoalteromonas sp. PPB1]|uniref:ImmA/IrrE family metallo-endopeptidase n=1 Tax=Pseudoalteromonas sp. PPB1 TaxID=2756136 RepID=UPI00189110F2|nr:ImmA/IrrE family metallo-endopeptidase [Pseudoalteromonas sp. PPB1]
MTSKKIQNEVFDLYYELGITQPAEIDLEAIAYHKQAVVKQKPLSGCEARIIGAGDSAIITVNSNSDRERQKFSIGHELGHWFKDRGKIGNLCAATDMELGAKKQKPRENIANQFASELLMPHFLMRSVINGSQFNSDLVSSVARAFDCSFMASLRRTIKMDHHMGFMACYKKCGTRRYFEKHSQLPGAFFPPRHVPNGSAVQKVISGETLKGPILVDGNVWCREDLASGSVVLEQAFHYHDDEFLTLVWWQDEEPIWKLCEAIGSL